MVRHRAGSRTGRRRTQAGEVGQIGGGLRVAGAAQDTARLGAEREDMAGLDQVGRFCNGIGQDADGCCAVRALMPVVMPRAHRRRR